ncbi:MAG: hypothetical protein DMG88_17425 [Acidobacteria bacterium]|nr:MAG: hypothetical protein DMG88_17425 [Acidobacteriota bacterium]
MNRVFARKLRLQTVFLYLMIGSAVPVFAQDRGFNGRTPAVDVASSRAELEAEQIVSLSSEKIISLLQQETGLFLQVKRLLVRKAYEQGRLLDPDDLTDEALYRLVREDQNIRVLITLEIEDRSYVRAKPSREELERNGVYQSSAPDVLSAAMQAPDIRAIQGGQIQDRQSKSSHSQEEDYWSTHDTQVNPNQGQFSLPQAPNSDSREGQDTPKPSTTDPRRQLQRTQMQAPFADSGDLQSTGSLLAKIQPDQLPALLNASSVDRSLLGTGQSRSGLGGLGAGNGISGAAAGLNSNSSMLGQTPSSLLNLLQGQNNNDDELPPTQQAKLNNKFPLQSSQSPSLSMPARPMLHHRPNPYADVPSLYDLYTQYSRRSPLLERFGEAVFRNGTGNADDLPMDLPAGPDYVVGPGDGLSIELWGAVSQRLRRVVDREGRVALPEAGSVQVAGRNLGDVQHLVQSVLRTQFRDVEADVSLSRVRTVRVYVVGDVQRPGAYDISSLSTPLNALYAAGGSTSQGSLRVIRHYRGKQLVQEVDTYDLLLHGIRSDLQRLQPGDTVLIPPLGPQATIEGMVQRPAIYELRGEKSLAEVLELAGGVLPSGTLRHIDVERLQAHESRTMLALDVPENNNKESVNQALQDFQIQDGDSVKISPIMSFAEKAVYLDGHVFRPGKYAYREGMKLTDLIHSYKDLLPEPYGRHAEIIRLNPPDYTPAVLAFNLSDALAGKEQDLVLKPFDTVRVFGRYDFEDPPMVSVTGEVRDPGDHVTNGATYVRDAVYLAGGATPDALLSDAQVFRKTQDGGLKVISVNLANALKGDEKDNVLLEPKDRVFIQRTLQKVDPATVIIAGEVARPGKYPLGRDMSAADLVRVAGGLKRGAYTQSADLMRYTVEDGKKVQGEHQTVDIAKALAGEADTDVRLRDGDVLTIGELAGWQDVGATIEVKGEVVHPGVYGIREGERLSSVIARAGGFRSDAYVHGTIFQREQVRELEAKNRADLITQVQTQGAGLKLIPTNDEDQKVAKEAVLLQWQTMLERLQSTPPAGRLVVHISSDMKRWANTPADIQVRAKDVVFIPKKPSSVMVDGSVYNPTAVAYKPGKSAGWYLNQAGGPNNLANKKAIFVIRADGSVVGGRGGLFSGGAESASMQPGDMVVVPERGFSANTRWKTTLQSAQLAYAVGIAIQVARHF